jgi:hypothetical protein
MYPATRLPYLRANGRSFQSRAEREECLAMCSACSCRKGRRDVTRIPTTSAEASGIANFTPNLGIQPISSLFLLVGNTWKTGRGKHIPGRDLPLHRISQKRIAKELLQQNLSLIVFYASLYKPHRLMHPPTFLSFRHSLFVVTLGSHKQASLPSIVITRVDGKGDVELGRTHTFSPAQRERTVMVNMHFSDCEQQNL